MKTTFTIISALIWSLLLPCLSAPPHLAVVKRKSSGGAPAPTYIIEENCEGAGTPSGWSNTGGTPDWDYTATVLQGSESLELSTADITEYAISDASDLWAYCMFRAPDVTPTSTISIIGIRAGATPVAAARLNTDGTLTVYCNGADSSKTVTALADNTTYHIWLHMVKSGTCTVAFSTDGTKPTSGNQFQSRTGGTGTITKIDFRNPGGQAFFDRLLLSAEEIPSSP